MATSRLTSRAVFLFLGLSVFICRDTEARKEPATCCIPLCLVEAVVRKLEH